MLKLSVQACQILKRAVQNDMFFVLYSVPITFTANPELVWVSVPKVPLDYRDYREKKGLQSRRMTADLLIENNKFMKEKV